MTAASCLLWNNVKSLVSTAGAKILRIRLQRMYIGPLHVGCVCYGRRRLDEASLRNNDLLFGFELEKD